MIVSLVLCPVDGTVGRVSSFHHQHQPHRDEARALLDGTSIFGNPGNGALLHPEKLGDVGATTLLGDEDLLAAVR